MADDDVKKLQCPDCDYETDDLESKYCSRCGCEYENEEDDDSLTDEAGDTSSVSEVVVDSSEIPAVKKLSPFEIQKQEKMAQLEAMEVVLNGGSHEMESTTIPFRCFFSPEQIAMNPTHILVVVKNTLQVSNMHSSTMGNRFILEEKNGLGFINVFSPGDHHLEFYAFHVGTDKDDIHRLKRLLAKDSYSRTIYDRDIDIEGLSNGFYDSGFFVVGYKAVKIDVPRGVFAEIPQSGWRKVMFQYINKPFSTPPIDKCAYRRRWPAFLISWFWFTVVPLVKALYVIFQFITGLLFAILAPIVFVVIGYRPNFKWEYFKECLSWECDVWDDYITPQNYRNFGQSNVDAKFVPVTLLELVAFFGGLGLSYLSFSNLTGLSGDDLTGMWFMGVISCLIVGVICLAWINRFAKTEIGSVLFDKLWNFISPPLTEEEYQAWLLKNASLNVKPTRVDIMQSPRAFGGMFTRSRQGIVKRFYAAKIKVCQPYAK